LFFNSQFDFFCTNTGFAPYTIKIEFKSFKNKRANVELPYYTVIPGISKDKFLFYIEPPGKGKWSYNYKYKYTFGDSLNTVHDDNYPYLFPVVLLFIRNGFNKKLNVTVTLTLENLKSGKGKEITIQVDSLSEIYLLQLKIIDSSKKWTDSGTLPDSLRFKKT